MQSEDIVCILTVVLFLRGKIIINRSERFIAFGFIFSFILLCLATILILPPYEGFDETGHYSYISLLSDRHKIPDFRNTPLDATVEKDRKGLPRPYGRKPPYEENEGITYVEFFNEISVLGREKAVRAFWQRPKEIASYEPGQGINWEGQHPPLYYLVMVIPYRLVKGWAPGMRILFLRFFSILIACGSLVFWFKTILLLKSETSRRLMLFAGLVVVFLPSLFHDLSRLGNDSMSALVFAGILYFMFSSYVNRQSRLSDFVGLSIMLGLGLLTKLFFVPLMIGAIIYSLWLGIKITKIGIKPLLLRLSLLGCIPLLLAGWWFVIFYQRYGMIFGSSELYMFRQIASPPGFELTKTQFLMQMIRIIAAFLATFLWAGSWSWVHRPLWYYAFAFPLLILTARNLICFIRKKDQQESRFLLISAIVLIAPLLIGFLFHMYMRVKFTGVGSGTGGYYLFFAWPVIGIIFSSVFEMRKNRTLRIITLIIITLFLFFEISGWWFSALVYSGIVKKMGACKTGIGLLPLTPQNLLYVLHRLRGVVFPCWAVFLYIVSLIIKSFLAIKIIFCGWPIYKPTPSESLDLDDIRR